MFPNELFGKIIFCGWTGLALFIAHIARKKTFLKYAINKAKELKEHNNINISIDNIYDDLFWLTTYNYLTKSLNGIDQKYYTDSTTCSDTSTVIYNVIAKKFDKKPIKNINNRILISIKDVKNQNFAYFFDHINEPTCCVYEIGIEEYDIINMNVNYVHFFCDIKNI